HPAGKGARATLFWDLQGRFELGRYPQPDGISRGYGGVPNAGCVRAGKPSADEHPINRERELEVADAAGRNKRRDCRAVAGYGGDLRARTDRLIDRRRLGEIQSHGAIDISFGHPYRLTLVFADGFHQTEDVDWIARL